MTRTKRYGGRHGAAGGTATRETSVAGLSRVRLPIFGGIRGVPAILLAILAVIGGGAAAKEREPAKTVAVLDFINRRPGDGNDWLSKGLADMVITDLSASGKLTVVDRERMQRLAREFDLAAAGIVDAGTAPAAGRIAKADWLLLGTYSCLGGTVTLEALLVDVPAQQTLRIEQIEGPLDDVFALESRLTGRVLENLNSPMTAAELRRVELLKTQSLPAFEHYSRSLQQFDTGQWYAALQEARLATKADPGYLMAAARVAQLYHEVGEPEHALIEYRRLAAQDEQNALPESVYFRMAVVLDESMADRATAAEILQRILDRYGSDLPPFDVTVPSRLSRGWEDMGGVAEVNRIAMQNETWLRTLARLAHWQEEAGNRFEAARLRSRMRHFMYSHGMPYGHQSLQFGSTTFGPAHTGSAYWSMVRENRDRTLYPGTVALLSPGVTVDADTKPSHGYYKWQSARFWLAPPDCEIAQVSYCVGGPDADQPEPTSGPGDRDADRPATSEGPVQIDFFSPEGVHSHPFEIVKVKPDGQWHEMAFDKGIRALKTMVFHNDRWQMRFTLRPFSGPAEMPQLGSFQVNVLPGGAEVFTNGNSHGHIEQGIAFVRIPTGQYTVEARWPDGRHRSTVVQVEQGRRIQFSLSADVRTVSRKVVAPQGSHPCLIKDRTGRFWLIWDEHQLGRSVTSNKDSNLYAANSLDGSEWSRPRRLPVSSLNSDDAPVLRQDRRGVYWLVWISDRGAKTEKNLWIASSSNGIEWSFPRKVALPEEAQGDLNDWRQTQGVFIALTIDPRNVFWLVWNGWLLRSDDAVVWHVDSELRTGDGAPDRLNAGRSYHLSCDAAGRLLLLTSGHGADCGTELWRRSPRGDWQSIDRLTGEYARHAGSTASRDDGSILAVTPHGSDLYVHEFDSGGHPLEPVIVETYLTLPFHPAIAPLTDGRWLVTFGSTEGLVAAVFDKELENTSSTNATMKANQ